MSSLVDLFIILYLGIMVLLFGAILLIVPLMQMGGIIYAISLAWKKIKFPLFTLAAEIRRKAGGLNHMIPQPLSDTEIPSVPDITPEEIFPDRKPSEEEITPLDLENEREQGVREDSEEDDIPVSDEALLNAIKDSGINPFEELSDEMLETLNN